VYYKTSSGVLAIVTSGMERYIYKSQWNSHWACRN